MRKTIYLTCLLISVLICAVVRSQEITLNRDGAPLQDLFLEIHNQTGYFFYYSNKDLSGAKPVTIHVTKAPLEEVLNLCFAGQPLVYRLENKTIVVQKKNIVNQPPIDTKGKIMNEQGDPVEDVTVGVQGSRIVTTTNSDGEFTLEKIPDESILVLSHVGYQTRTLSLNKKANLTVILKRIISSLDEVQVIAYGTTTKRLNTGDVTTVKSEDIEKQPITDPLSALEGRVSGLSVIQQTGVTGSSFLVKIRGQNSISSGNDPLYIIDGVPFPSAPMGSLFSGIIQNGDPLGSIDPASISSVEVLKDADATSIYGSRGANGVILITTKKGKAGKTRLDVSAYSGFLKLTQPLKLLSKSEYLQMRREAFSNDGVVPDISNAPDLLIWDTTRSTDWQKVLLGGTGETNDLHASVSGGDSLTNVLLGGGYHRETTVFPGNFSDQKVSAHISVQHFSFNRKFSMQFSGSYLSDNNYLPGMDLTAQALSLPPDAPPIYDSSGNLNWAHSSWTNPLRITKTLFLAKTETLNSNLVLGYQLTADLEMKINAGYNRLSFNETSTFPLGSYDPAWGIPFGAAAFAENNSNTWILEPQLQWKRSLGSSKVEILIGSTFQGSNQKAQTLDATGFTNDALIENIAGASNIYVIATNDLHYKYQALFARLLYNINNRWLFDFTGRRDGSSRFGPGNQFASFGAVGASWIFSNQPFIQKRFAVLSFGKCRTSWGVTGNDQIGDYQYLSTYSPTPYPYDNTGGLYPNNLSNPNYSWEKNNKWEGALETGWFHDRLLLNASYYINRSSSQLVPYALPLITGFSSIVANLPALLMNSGWEFDINSRNVRSRSFTWTSSINLSIPKSKLIAFPGIAGSSYATRYAIGKPLGIVHAFDMAGVNPETGVYQFYDSKGDLTNNPVYPDDLKTNKVIQQDLFGGLGNSFQYKGWSLDVFFQFVKQSGRDYRYSFFSVPGTLSNQPEAVTLRWQKSGNLTNIQKYSQDPGSAASTAYYNVNGYGDNTVVDASFISLKNIAISYNLSSATLNRFHISLFKIFIQGQNLLTINHYTGLSPQTQNFNNIPLLTTITVGFQIRI